MDVALGLSVHTGWAVAVLVSGDGAEPVIHDRRRVELVPPDVERFAYHLVQDWPLPEAEASVAAAHEGVERATDAVVDDLVAAAEPVGTLVGLGLTGQPGDELPPLEAILAKHTLLHTAEGELFRGALVDAAARRALPVTTIHQKRGVAEVATSLDRDPDRFATRLAALRKELGAPWTADHKLATAAALAALHAAG